MRQRQSALLLAGAWCLAAAGVNAQPRPYPSCGEHGDEGDNGHCTCRDGYVHRDTPRGPQRVDCRCTPPAPPPPPAPVVPAVPRPTRPTRTAAVAENPMPQPGVPTSCPEGMVLLPSGTFTMREPAHQVTLPAFCIERTEVTVAAYQACVDAGRCAAASRTVAWPGITNDERNQWSRFCNANFADRGAHPVNCVAQPQATAYCRWRYGAAGALPTEDQWEFAARGGLERTYPWGNEAPDRTRVNACGDECVRHLAQFGITWPRMYEGDDGWPTTAPVGTFPRGDSPQGLHDMAGNVWEWTRTPYGDYTSASGSVTTYTAVDRTRRVLRGGAWYSYDVGGVRAGNRFVVVTSFRSYYVGFRCVREGN